jgi:hypothetical protein
MTQYYVSVPSDGIKRDRFSSAKDVDYLTGEVVVSPEENIWRGFALATVPTACQDVTWPARLLAVEPVGETDDESDREWLRNPTRLYAKAFRVIEERPAAELFGPQGEQVIALFERIRTATPEQMVALSDNKLIYSINPNNQYLDWTVSDRAEYDPDDAAETVQRGGAVEVGGEWDVCETPYATSPGEQRNVRAVLETAIAALVLRDVIKQGTYDRATGPVRDVFGPLHPDDVTPEPRVWDIKAPKYAYETEARGLKERLEDLARQTRRLVEEKDALDLFIARQKLTPGE